jgi:hypothetical protein
MRKLLLALPALPTLLAACGGAPATVPPPERHALIAATDEGLALVDAATGNTLISCRSRARVDHLVLDPYRRALLTFESDDRDAGGVIVSRPLDALGRDEQLGYLDGAARLHPAPFGVVVFEESYGTRWRLLGSPHGIAAPMPSAVWSSPSGVQTLTLDEQGWSGRTATLAADGLSIATGTVDPRAPFARAIALGFPSIADARALDSELDVLLVASPPRVVVASASRVVASFALDDDVRTDLTRGLVVVDPEYVLVGTTHTLRALRVRRAPEIAIEAAFVAPTGHAPIDGPL